MFDQTELLIVLLEYLSFLLLKPLIELLQPKLDECKQLVLAKWARLGSTNDPRLAQVLGKEQIDRRQWWSRLHNEIGAYYEELARALGKRLNVLEYYNTLVGDHVWSRRATEAMQIDARAANAIALRRLQADTLLKWPDVSVRLEPLDNPFVLLANWSSADLLVISTDDGEASGQTGLPSSSFDWRTFLAFISEPAGGRERISQADREAGPESGPAASREEKLREAGMLARRRKPIGESRDSEPKFNEAHNVLDQGHHQQAIGPDCDRNRLASVPMIGSKREADKCDENNKQRRLTKTKLIYSSFREHEALISITWPEEDGANQQTSGTFCWIKHLTLAEYRLHDARSRLVFRLCQRERHLETLPCLYGVVSSLLERASLLEPGGFCLRQANQLTRRTEQVARAEHELNLIRAEKGAESKLTGSGAAWWPDSVEMLISDCESHNSIRPTKRRLLTRYALFLMVAAYLGQREKQMQQEGRLPTANKQLHANNLASLLAGFLATFSQLVLTDEAGEIDTSARPRERSGPAEAEQELKIITVEGVEMPRPGHVVCGISISFTESAESIIARDYDGKLRQLIVLDPAATEVHSNKIGQQFENSNEVLNLTKDLEVWPQINDLFTQFYLTLSRPERASNQSRNTLGTLLDMSDKCRLERLSGVSWKLDEKERLAMLEDEGENGNEETKGSRCQLRRTSAPFERFFATGGSSWAKSGVWKNLLYLVMFLLVKNALLNYLQDWQRELKHSARDDFIELKRILFPESYLAAAEEADAKDDGISILMRDENTLEDEYHHLEEDALEQEREQDLEHSDEQSDGLDASGGWREGSAANTGDDTDNEAADGAERASMDQTLGLLFGGLLSKGLAGDGGLDGEKLQRIFGAMGDEENLDVSQMGELLAAFQQLMPALSGTGGTDGLANLAKMFANLEVEGDDEPEGEPDHHQETGTKGVEKDAATSSEGREDHEARPKAANGQPANIGSPTASGHSKQGRASSPAPSSHTGQSSSTTSATKSQADTASDVPTRQEL